MLQDISDKYPPWLEANKSSLSAEDLQRYTAQYASIQAVCKQYEEDPSNFARLTDLIQQVSTACLQGACCLNSCKTS